jgi:hypothetical protein
MGVFRKSGISSVTTPHETPFARIEPVNVDLSSSALHAGSFDFLVKIATNGNRNISHSGTGAARRTSGRLFGRISLRR